MSRYKKHSVILVEDVYTGLVEWFSQVRPKEGMAFLAGKIRCASIYEITHLYMPEQKTTRDSFVFTDTDRLEATVWAGRQNALFLGIAHSHINKELNHYGTMLSLDDAELQQQNHITLMLVLGFFGRDRLAMTCWKEGFSASLELYRRSGKRLVRLLESQSVPFIRVSKQR